ncbi:protein kinase [Archangium violaceum]|uniref:protein kinase domain-containing protein n=1 Tax=Archangium violaceum TaxID=83451 RepID=UPI0019522254|nr:protein kinase [Archangium violaceum]QRO02217.1 protein kinase [Archangium violaceum]
MTRHNDDSQGTPLEARPVSEGRDSSDFGDSFLREVSQFSLAFPAPRPGERLGGRDGRRFEILGRLGKGGMGLVVRARDELLQRIVALKFISSGRELTRESLDQLIQEEARLVAQLDHENIVRIFDVSEWKGTPFLIMEYLEGQSLDTLLRRGALEPRRALRILSDVTAGLAHAHSRQVLHRDLKPSNVFILPDGRVKLLDFGLGGFASSLGFDLLKSGTPAFMAPEQWRGQPQDMRTDTWAVGLLLYQMLTGELPHPAGNLRMLRKRVLSAEPVPSVRARHPDLPETVDRFLARALAKDPSRRFQSALEMYERLRVLEWSLAPSDEATPPRFTPHRRQVTLVCCRLTGHLASLDPEDLSDVQAAFHQACSRILEHHGGWVTLRMGDEVLGCFGYPLIREEDVVCAVRAALELTRMVEELPRAFQSELAVQVGVHTDLVVLDVSEPSAPSGRHSPSIRGEAPHLARWLARQAEPQTVDLSENTWQGAQGNFVTEPLGQRFFQSSLGPMRVGVHRLRSERPETTRFGRALARGLTPLVGRSAELRQLFAWWEEARRGQGTVVLLSGEAGIGKSRLIQELSEHVVHEGGVLVSSQCWPQLSRSAFHPVLEWVTHLAALEPEASPERRRDHLEEVLRSLDMPLPESLLLLGQLLGLPPREELPPLLLSPEQQRARTLETLTTLLLRLSARLPGRHGQGPLLLVLEDLHWVDPSTLRFLSRLGELIDGTRLLLLLSARPELRLSLRQHPRFHLLVLDRLAADETAEMVRRLIGNRPEPSAETVALLVRRTEGIPLFVEEMTRSMVLTHGSQSTAEGTLPVTLQELLLARLDPLPPEQKELAWKGAVIGRGFTEAQLAALSERGGSTLRRDLEELVEAGLLLHTGEEPELRYEFRHALIQEAAYESLVKPRRRQYHHQIAVLLEHPVSGAPTAPPELIAHHYTRAGELLPAVRYWALAGELALNRSAFEESISHLEQALRLFKRLPGAARRVEEELRLLVLLGQALIAARNYSAPEVEQLYARIAQLFHDVRNTPILVSASMGLFNRNLMRLNFPLARELSEQIVSLGQRVHEPQLRVVGRLMGGSNCLIQGDVLGAVPLLEEAVALGTSERERAPRTLGMLEPDPLAMAQAYLALTLTLRCEQREGQRLSDSALCRTEQLGHPYTFVLVSTVTNALYQMRFDARRVLAMTEREGLIYEQNPSLRVESWMPVLRGWALVLTGQRREEGYTLMLEGLDHLRQNHAETGWPYLLCLLADARARLGMIPEGLAAVAEGLAWGERTGQHLEEAELYRLRGELLLLDGETARAVNEFQESSRSARRSGARCVELRATLRLCQLQRGQDRLRHAERLLRDALAPLPPGLDSPELRVARALLDGLQDEHFDEHELERLMSAAPWELGHIREGSSPTFMEPL